MRHIAFLRAVNLGKRTVKMPHLVELVRGLGHEDVWTHINSGNVVFEASGSRTTLERQLEAALEDDLGFEVTTFVRTEAELRRTLALEPFPVAPADTYFVTFLKDNLPSRRRRRSKRSATTSTPSWSRVVTCTGACTASRPTRSSRQRRGSTSSVAIAAPAATRTCSASSWTRCTPSGDDRVAVMAKRLPVTASHRRCNAGTTGRRLVAP